MLKAMDNKLLMTCYGMHRNHVTYFSRSMLEDVLPNMHVRTLNRRLKRLVDLGLLETKEIRKSVNIYAISEKGLALLDGYKKLVG